MHCNILYCTYSYSDVHVVTVNESCFLYPLDDDDYAQVKDPDKLLKVLGRPLSPHDIVLTERIGEGQFGDVHKGILYPNVRQHTDIIGGCLMPKDSLISDSYTLIAI